MAPAKDSADIDWYEPEIRGILPLDDRFRVTKNLRRLLRNGGFEERINTAFEEVMHGCAERPETWISPRIVASYSALHRHRHAHSLEVWQDGALVGGLYGVQVGAVFFGESMFQRVPEAHKVALAWAHQRLQAGGFRLWDTQLYSDHLGTFGAQQIQQEAYLKLLLAAFPYHADFARLPLRTPA